MSSLSNTSSGITGPEYYASGSFYGLKFFNEIKDNLDFDRVLPCIPDIFVSDENTKILLDYTSCIENSSSNYINNIINGISMGNGFTLENAKYIDQITGVESDLSGFYTYAATFDKAIYATTSGIDKAEKIDKKYKSEGFVEEFRAIFQVENENTTEQNIIKNTFGTDVSPSFTNLGLKIGDYIKILNGNNSSSTKLHQVINFFTDYNDHEIIIFDDSADLVDENRIGLGTDLRLYRNDSSTSNTTYYKDSIGDLIFTSNTLEMIGTIVVLHLQVANNKFLVLNKETPNLVLTTNCSYIFGTTSLNTNEHSFRISSVEDGTWNGGHQHPDIEVHDNFVLFTPKKSGIFYYYCENHPSMGGAIKVSGGFNRQLKNTSGFIDPSTSYTIQTLSQEVNSIFY